MSNETYTDLEQEALRERHNSMRMEIIEMLAHLNPNDADLGAKVREFINLQNKTY